MARGRNAYLGFILIEVTDGLLRVNETGVAIIIIEQTMLW
jgi:hypothetical protein